MDEAPASRAEGDPALRARGRSSGPRRRRRGVSFLGVIGEILITAGVVTLLYVVWQLWVGDLIYGAERNATGAELTQTWAEQFDAAPAPPPAGDADADEATIDPVILAEPEDAEEFGVLRIPRFGDDYAVPMAGGITRARTLDPIGVGHYPGTKMPGEVGNFAVAAHRTTWGKPFGRIADLRLNDAIVVETPDGWYTYRFRTLEYVTPDRVDVLLPVPQATGAAPGTAYMTMTSCSPVFSMAERIVAYSVFDLFTPRSAGEPASLNGTAA